MEDDILASLHDPLAMSREYALLGNYDTSLIYFEQVNRSLSSYIATVSDPAKKNR
jgi:katanin p60 ATPase-containing subunit A1